MRGPILAGVLAAAASAPAAAQAASKPAEPVPYVPERRIVDSFAGCVAAKHPREAQQYALNQIASWRAGQRDAIARLKDKRCIPPQVRQNDAAALLKLPEDTIKSALAGALVRQEYPRFDATPIATAEPLPSAKLADDLWVRPEDCKGCSEKQRKDLAHVREVAANAMAPHMFSECVIRTDPANAHELLMAERGSPSERAAFDGLGGALGGCLAQGQKFTMTRTVLRDLIALNYYRLAHAPRAKVLAGAPH